MDIQNIFWIWFFVVVIIMLVIDLWVFNKNPHEVKIKEALIWTITWIWLALLFNIFVYFWLWQEKALEFLTWYVIEKALSVDNLFVFILVFSYFKVEKKYQHRILFWWILWAVIMRAIFIYLWIWIINKFHFIIYIFWAFLLYSWVKMIFSNNEEDTKAEENWIIQKAKKIIPTSEKNDNWKFFTIENWKKMATPLFLVLIVIELSDLIFAVDSIPAILWISNDMFIVYTSNIFAILWLRSLYFVLSWMMWRFEYLQYALAWILSFVWIKMLISWFYEIAVWVSLLIILWFLVVSILASVIKEKIKGK